MEDRHTCTMTQPGWSCSRIRFHDGPCALSPIENPKTLVDLFPLISSAFIECGNIGQLWRMWTERTAAGQNLWSYVSILIALLLWVVYFRLRIGKKLAYYVTLFSLLTIGANIITIALLRWVLI